MSAIGDYIHYHTQNYFVFGTREPGTDGPSWTAQLNKVYMQYKYQNSLFDTDITREQARIQEIQNRFTDLVGNEEFFNSDQIKRAVLEFLQEELGSKGANLIGVNLQTTFGQFSSYNQMLSSDIAANRAQLTKTLRALKVNWDGQWQNKSRDRLLRRINVIYNRIDQNFNKWSSFPELKTQLEQDKKLLQQLQERIKNDTSPARQYTTGTWVASILNDSGRNLEDLKRIFDVYNTVSVDVSNLSGMIWEVIVALLNPKVRNYSSDELKRYLQQAIKGNTRTTLTFDQDGIIIDNADYEIKRSEGTIQFKNLRSKVDTVITLGDEKNPIKVSAKNIGAGANADSRLHGIKLVDETNIYRVFVTMRNNELVNHYINLWTESDVDLNINWGGLMNVRTDLSHFIQHHAFRVALAGFNYNDEANYFVINTTKGMTLTPEVYSIPLFLYNALNLQSSQLDNILIYEGGNPFHQTIIQKSASSPKTRIDNILSQYKNRKITMRIKLERLQALAKYLI